MAREVKVGLGVITLLTVSLVVVVAKRWRPPVRVIPTVETLPTLARPTIAQPRQRAAGVQPLVLQAQSQPRGALEQPIAFEQPRKSEPEPSGSYLPRETTSAAPEAADETQPAADAGPRQLQTASRRSPGDTPAHLHPDGFGSDRSPPTSGRDPLAPSLSAAQTADGPPSANHLQAPGPSSLPDESLLATGTYTVRAGDSLYRLATRVYGDDRWFLALAAHNRQRLPNPHRLQVGDQIDLVSREELRRRYPGFCPQDRGVAVGPIGLTASAASLPAGGRAYLVEEGDSLYQIAKYELGDPQRWVEIYQLNRSRIGNDANLLVPGLSLVLPGPSTIEDGAQRVTRGDKPLQR